MGISEFKNLSNHIFTGPSQTPITYTVVKGLTVGEWREGVTEWEGADPTPTGQRYSRR